MSSNFCGLPTSSSKSKSKASKPIRLTKHQHPRPTDNNPLPHNSSAVRLSTSSLHSQNEEEPPIPPRSPLRRRKSDSFQWAREDQLSVVLELLEDESRGTPGWEKPEPQWQAQQDGQEQQYNVLREETERPDTEELYQEKAKWTATGNQVKRPRGEKVGRILTYDSIPEPRPYYYTMDNRRSASPMPKPIAAPPRDLESISRIDASLKFEHFTTSDAWDLGSALRARLLPIPTPVVISISLANANQVLFHCTTHSGTMPDNDRWVARKRNTVLRWGVSTWYMSCKFGGDEGKFRDKYGLGERAGEYAIHGGGIPIRVAGVEGVVAVVVVSGLKQEEDHAVIVEVIKELYY